MAKGQLESKFGERNQPEKTPAEQQESSPIREEALRKIKTVPPKIKRGRQRAAVNLVALKASNIVFDIVQQGKNFSIALNRLV